MIKHILLWAEHGTLVMKLKNTCNNPNSLQTLVKEHFLNLSYFIENICHDSIIRVADVIYKACIKKKNIYILGNGGSASTALHMSNDFSAINNGDYTSIRTQCLNANISTLSAIANDYGFDTVFIKQLKGILQPEDVLIGISASGNSMNCINAFSFARECGASTIGLLGFDGGKMKELCDYYIHTPIKDYFIVEDIHLCVSHALTIILRNLLNPLNELTTT